MTLLDLPWLEIGAALALLGALGVSRLYNPTVASRWALACTGAVLGCTLLEWLRYTLLGSAGLSQTWSAQPFLFGRRLFQVDELAAPLIPTIALLHFLTAVATTRTKMRRFSFSWSLTCEALRLGIFACTAPWVLIGLFIACTIPPYFELVNRGKSPRIYVLHMALFAWLLILGWSIVEWEGNQPMHSAWATVPLLLAVLIRCGMFPLHCWLTDWFEKASFGNALLFVAPLSGVCVAVRLVLPIASEGVLKSLSVVSLTTAVYASGMALVQRDARRFFAYLFLSHASLVLVGLELVTPISLTGALCLWFSVILALGGFGLVLRALEARFGRLTLTSYCGLYDSSPVLAVSYLLTGLASVGFPGTVGFISTDLLVDGAIEVNLSVGVAVVLATALNGIAVLKSYLLLFTGARHTSTVSLRVGWRERLAVLTLSALLLGGGLVPQPGVATRHAAAEQLLAQRRQRQEKQQAEWHRRTLTLASGGR